MTVSIEGTTPGIAVDGTGAVVNVTVTTGDGGGGGGVTDHGLLTGLSDDDHTQYAKKASNLSDLASAATARTNLGLGTAAVAATGDFDAAGTAAGLVDDLSGVSNQATARTNLGLGTAATAATGDFAATSHTHTGTQVTVDASGFNGNLTTSDDTVQEVAQKLDDLVIPAAGIADPGGSNDDFLQRKAGAWTNRTVAQVKTDLGITDRPPPTAKVVGYYAPSGLTAGNMTSPLTAAGTMAAAPVWLWAGSYTEVGNAYHYSGTSTVRFGLYDATGTGGYPGSLVSGADFGTISCVNGSPGAKSITISFTLATSGWYWIAALCDAYTSTGEFVGYPNERGYGPMKVPGFPTYGDSNGASCVTTTGVSTGSMPSTFGTPTWYIGIRFPVIRLYLNS